MPPGGVSVPGWHGHSSLSKTSSREARGAPTRFILTGLPELRPLPSPAAVRIHDHEKRVPPGGRQAAWRPRRSAAGLASRALIAVQSMFAKKASMYFSRSAGLKSRR